MARKYNELDIDPKRVNLPHEPACGALGPPQPETSSPLQGNGEACHLFDRGHEYDPEGIHKFSCDKCGAEFLWASFNTMDATPVHCPGCGRITQ